MSEEELQDIKKRVIRLVDQFDYALTVEQLHILVKRQIPKMSSFDIIEVIHQVANNGDLPPGKYIILPGVPLKEALKVKKHRVISAPVVENGPLPMSATITTSQDQYLESDWNVSEPLVTDSTITLTTTTTNEPTTILKEELPEMEERTNMSEEQFAQLDAQYEVLINGDKIFLHPRFKKEADRLPEKILDLFEEFGEMTPAEVVEKLEEDEAINFDTSTRGMRIAFVVAWKQVESKLIDAATLLT